MATPMTAAQWQAALTAEGLSPEYRAGWKTFGRDAATGKTFGPVNGVVIHHTAGRDDLSVIVKGTATLPPPLAHAWSGRAKMVQVSIHRANHAGSVPQNVYDAMVAESGHPDPGALERLDGNDFTYGLEIENKGDGQDVYTEDQYDRSVRWASAVCRFHKWTAASVFGHKEVTRRKIDPRGPVAGYGTRGKFEFTMTQFRTDVADRLKHPASWSPPQSTTPAETIASRVADLEKWARTKGFTG